MTFKTPGVYVQEMPLFPSSVAEVATAIPAFIGYTEKAEDENANSITTFPFVKRIRSLAEYKQYFGKAQPQQMIVSVEEGNPTEVTIGDPNTPISKYRMYYALQMYFANGGGPCFIVCVGNYSPPQSEAVGKDKIIEGLAALKKLDEPTLILFPDAVNVQMDDFTNHYDLIKAALKQCSDLGDRFLICDLYEGDTIDPNTINTGFRTGIGNNFLKYGAAYHPWLKTNLGHYYHGGAIKFTSSSDHPFKNQWLADVEAIIKAGDHKGIVDQVNLEFADETDENAAITLARKLAVAASEGAKAVLEAAIFTGLTNQDPAKNAYLLAESALSEIETAKTKSEAEVHVADAVKAIDDALVAAIIEETQYESVKAKFTNAFENKVRQLLDDQKVTLPPGSAVAGVYATVDRTRGVWKAPANASLNSVIEPSVKISSEDQSWMNIHPSGKSINAIRAFAGKGTMVWGARTLAGNDNEWRYVSTRRFFNMVEESIKKATEHLVFEPNDVNTWVKVRAMIENFLVLQWRAGALAGATAEEAFFVRVGLGQTMTAVDILEGRMNVEIGMAVARPAEFIILRFSHKMQES
jgi:phage tail sheath protein FI